MNDCGTRRTYVEQRVYQTWITGALFNLGVLINC